MTLHEMWRRGLLVLVLGGLLLATGCGETGGASPDGDDTDGDLTDGDDVDGDDPDGDEPRVATAFQLGFAVADLTPPPGTVLGGYGAPGGLRGIESVNDPLLAQVAVFTNDAGQAFMLISQDSAGYSHDFGDWGPGVGALRQAISEAVKDRLDLAPEQIVLNASHSHAATDLVGFWQKFYDGVPKDLLDWHIAEITAAAQEAVAGLQAVTLTFARTELVGYSGRDHEGLTGLDNTVTVLQARDEAGDIVLTLTHYAKHPTMLGESNRVASADFIWGYREELGAATGAPAMYLQGFVAALHDGVIEVEGEDDFERAYAVGKALADAVLAIPEFTPATEFDIRHRATTFTAPLREGMVKDVFDLFDMPKRHFTRDEEGVYWMGAIPTSWHKLGPAEFVAMPGEPTPEAALRVRQQVVSPFAFPLGLSNDCIGYIIDADLQDNTGLQGYELKMGLGRDVGIIAWEEQEALGWADGGWRD